MPDITLTELFTGVIAVISTIVFFRRIPTKKDFQMLVERMDRYLEYHAHNQTSKPAWENTPQ